MAGRPLTRLGMLRVVVALVALAVPVAVTIGGWRSCASTTTSTSASSKSGPGERAPAASATIAPAAARCRAEGAPVTIPGEEVVVGEALSIGRLLVSTVRRDGARRVTSIVDAAGDLGSMKTIEIGPAAGDDPPAALRLHGGEVRAAFFARKADADAGTKKLPLGYPGVTRELRVVAIEKGTVSTTLGSVLQHADESLAFDLTWGEGAAMPLVAWDEDAPAREGKFDSDRGLIKVQILGGATARVASPEGSDAEMPRLLGRKGGGFWLAWLAKRREPGEKTEGSAGEAGADATYALEGPGEHRAYRWVELVALDAKGEPASPVRRASPEKGHAIAFELAVDREGELSVIVQDEAAGVDGEGGRILRYPTGDRAIAMDLVDAGVGHALAELALGAESGPRWLSWTDTHDKARLAPLSPLLLVAAAPSAEPALEGYRLLATSGGAIYATSHAPSGALLARFRCEGVAP